MMMLNLLRGRRLREETTGCGLHDGQLPVLECLITRPGCTQRQLAQRLVVTPASIAQSTKRLQRAGLIEKRVDKENLRCNQLYATESGVETALEYRRSFDKVDAETLRGFTEDEMKTLVALLDRMITNINHENLSFSPPWKENIHD